MGHGRFEFRRLRRQFRRPLRTGAGEVGSVDRILLRTEGPEGVGFGEVAPWPGFPVEPADAAMAALREAGGDLGRLRGIVGSRSAALPCLAAALSMARNWAAIARFGGGVPSAGLLDGGNGSATTKLSEGFTTLKLKVAPGEGRAVADAVLAALPPGGRLRLDANGSLGPDEASEWAAFARAEARIEFLEQPLPARHPAYARLGKDRIALDESVANPASSPDAADWKGIVVLKPSMAGDWDDLEPWAADRRDRLVVSSAFETAVGRQAALWLSDRLRPGRVGGFDTLGRFEEDGRELHAGGPVARGRADIDWQAFWEGLP
jgi:O-succinylbenzoate synthase